MGVLAVPESDADTASDGGLRTSVSAADASVFRDSSPGNSTDLSDGALRHCSCLSSTNNELGSRPDNNPNVKLSFFALLGGIF